MSPVVHVRSMPPHLYSAATVWICRWFFSTQASYFANAVSRHLRSGTRPAASPPVSIPVLWPKPSLDAQRWIARFLALACSPSL